MCLGLLLTFWATGIGGLDRFPKVHEDEPWIAAPGYTFWMEGYFGTDVFAGFYSMEQRYYGFMPLFSLLVGGALWLFGMGLFQARIVPLALTLLTLALTYRVGAMLFSPRHGALAVTILALWRITTPTIYRVSGIPLADMARMVRYDNGVPVLGLAALLLVIHVMRGTRGKSPHPNPLSPPAWERSRGEGRFLLVGILCGLATLVHLYGAFWLPALLLPVWIVWRGRAQRAILWAGVGFGVTLLPYALYVLSGWSDFRSQFRGVSERFELLDPVFYITNLSRESARYQPLLDALGQGLGAGLWLALLIVGVGWLAYQAARRDLSARLALTTCAALTLMFAALLSPKTTMYLVTLWSLFTLIAAAGFWRLWAMRIGRRWMRLALAGVVVLACGEGVVARRGVQMRAQRATPYAVFTNQIASTLPPDSRLLAMQHYWFGLAGQTADYRSLIVPINLTNPRFVETPITFSEAVDAIQPDVIMYDQVMLDFLRETDDPTDPFNSLRVQMWAYLNERRARLIATLNDPTYGEAYLYQLSAPPD